MCCSVYNHQLRASSPPCAATAERLQILLTYTVDYASWSHTGRIHRQLQGICVDLQDNGLIRYSHLADCRLPVFSVEGLGESGELVATEPEWFTGGMRLGADKTSTTGSGVN